VNNAVMKKILVIIPTYNERQNIAKLLDNIIALGVNGLEILVIDDGSPDGTADVVESYTAAQNGVSLMKRSKKAGLGTAYVAGFKYALERDYNCIMEMDADFSHDPKEIPNFITAIEDSDLVLGSRYVQGVNVINWPLSRLILSIGASKYTRIITGMPIKDCTSGFKCFRRQVLESIDLDAINSDGYSFQIEMNFKAWKKGFKVREIPIVFTERAAGSSKMSKKIVREAVWMVWKLKLLSLVGKL
jgi:dolichol-phosphate mannosyltransferase